MRGYLLFHREDPVPLFFVFRTWTRLQQVLVLAKEEADRLGLDPSPLFAKSQPAYRVGSMGTTACKRCARHGLYRGYELNCRYESQLRVSDWYRVRCHSPQWGDVACVLWERQVSHPHSDAGRESMGVAPLRVREDVRCTDEEWSPLFVLTGSWILRPVERTEVRGAGPLLLFSAIENGVSACKYEAPQSADRLSARHTRCTHAAGTEAVLSRYSPYI
jgi:hypothetical protein